MFNNKKGNDEPIVINESPEDPTGEKPPAPEVTRRSVSVIGPTLYFKGELTANEDLVIEGRVEGTIAHQDKNLTIGKGGRVKADIHAKVIEIFGEVEGDVRGDEVVRMKKSAVVTGNIHSPRIMMEDGATFTGSIDMGERPKTERTEPASESEAPARAKLTVADPTVHAGGGGS